MVNSRDLPSTVCVVSSNPLLLPAVRGLLPESSFAVVGGNLGAAPARELEVPSASVYIFDTNPQGGPIEEAIRGVAAVVPSLYFLVMGDRFDETNAFPLLRLKARGLVTYSEAPDQLARAVAAVSVGGFWIPRALLSRFVEITVSSNGSLPPPASVAGLTKRESQVLSVLRTNLSNKEIAKKLGITERGVKFHVSNLLAKHHVRRRADLILLSLGLR